MSGPSDYKDDRRSASPSQNDRPNKIRKLHDQRCIDENFEADIDEHPTGSEANTVPIPTPFKNTCKIGIPLVI